MICMDILGIALTGLGMIIKHINTATSQANITQTGLIIHIDEQAQADRIPKIQNSKTRTSMDIQLH